MGIIIHFKILIGMLILACFLFVTGVVAFIAAFLNQNSVTTTPSPSPQIYTPEIKRQSDTLILTPLGTLEDIVADKDIVFSLVSVPKDWKIKAKLRIYQKEVRGEPYKNNFIEIAYLGKISDDSILEWKELDVTEKVRRELDKNKKVITFSVVEKNQRPDTDSFDNLAIFDAVAELVVEKE